MNTLTPYDTSRLADKIERERQSKSRRDPEPEADPNTVIGQAAREIERRNRGYARKYWMKPENNYRRGSASPGAQ